MSTPHLIVPIYVGTELKCCVPDLMRTEAVLSGAANQIAENEWEIYRAAGTVQVEGSVKFGICCAKQVGIYLTGRIETLDSGYDNIQVIHNGEQVFFFQSTEDGQEDEDATVSVGPFHVSINLDDRPCGHMIEISGGTVDDRANNDVWWKASVTIS